MIDVIVLLIVVLIIGGAATYIIREKKKGTRCIGCPMAGQCLGGCSENIHNN